KISENEGDGVTVTKKPWKTPPRKLGGKYADKAMNLTEFGEKWDRNHPVEIYDENTRDSFRVVAGPDGKLVYAETGDPVDIGQTNGIYVMDENGNMYVGEQEVFRIHHSSLASGEDPMGAGHIEVRDGQVIKINEETGHYGEYQPPGRSLMVKQE